MPVGHPLSDGTQVRTFESEARDNTVVRQFTDPTSILPGDSNLTDSAYFTVTTKNGQTRYYGGRASGNSRVIVTNPPNTFLPQQAIAMWLLDRVMDQWGNYYDISYNYDQGNIATAFSFVTTGVYPTEIRYTSHVTGTQQPTSPFFTIQFVYEGRPDVRSVRFGFTSVRQTVRLKEMDVFNTANQSVPLQTYTLTYMADDDVSLPSRLNTVKYCPRIGGCLPPITFTWQDVVHTWSENTSLKLPGPIEQVGAQNGDQIGLSFTKTHGTKLIDLDGDGLPDFVTARTGAPRVLRRSVVDAAVTWFAPGG